MKRKKLTILGILSITCLLFLVTSCEKKEPGDDGRNGGNPTEVIEVEGEITGNTTWKASDKILLKGFVYVTNGSTLTIEPGTVIKGDKATKATLIIEPGGKIMAQGTQSKPIVFTSNQAAGSRNYGDWGGLIICGKADVNAPSAMTIEGGPRTKYGKAAGFDIDDNDNSGILEYVRVEFSGVEYATDNEINGITFGGVGKGTKVDYVQVSYCGDDSFEWFGGNVNCKHLVAFRGWDDEFDTDNGYSGKLQFIVGLRDSNVADKSKSNGFESDNDSKGSTNDPYTQPIFSNVSLFGPYKTSAGASDPTGGSSGGSFQAAMHLRRSTKLSAYNSVFAGWPVGLFIDGKEGNAQQHATNGELVVKNSILAGMKKKYNNEFDSIYFNRENSGNKTFSENSELKIKDPFNLNNPIFTLEAGSPLIGTSNLFDDLNDPFFEKVDFIGAFGNSDWTIGWTNFDPQNTIYW